MKASVIRILAAIGAIVFMSPAAAGAAGMSVHSEVTVRAAHYFDDADHPEYRQLILAHPDAYQAGSPFPDWGFASGYHDASEDAHWPSYWDTFAQYIHDTYPKPWDEETERLVAFYCGAVSHGQADMDWHGLGGSEEGFIDVISAQETNGDWSAAHTIADTGGDFTNRYERDMDWLEMSWYFPYDDITAVYELRGYPGLTEEVLRPGTMLLFLGALGNKLGGWLVYPLFANQSTFLGEQLNDYFMGGLDGMAIRVMWIWRRQIDRVENGVPPSATRTAAFTHPAVEQDLLAAAGLGWRLWRLGLVNISVEPTDRGVLYRASISPALLSRTVPVAESSRAVTRFVTDEPYHYLGRSLAAGDFNADGVADLAIGAHGAGAVGEPQVGAVYLFYGRSTWNGELQADQADLVLHGAEPFDRFGWSLAVVDQNADGIDDLAVGAPEAQAATAGHTGRVYVFFGGEPFATPDIVIDDAPTYTHLGMTLAGGDVSRDGHADLLIGSPYADAGGEQRGLAAAFFSDAGLTPGSSLSLADADWRLDGPSNYDWYGYSLLYVDRGWSGQLLLVGAPGFDLDGKQAAGAVYGYDFLAEDPTLPLFTLTGENEFDKAGLALTAGKFYGDGQYLLAIGAPTASLHGPIFSGAVYLLPFEGLEGVQSLGDFAGAVLLTGSEKYGRFGWQLTGNDLNGDAVDDLVVTQPWRETKAGRMAGTAYFYAGGASFPGEPAWRVAGTREQAMLGIPALAADINADGRRELLLGSARDSALARHGGTVVMLQVGDTLDDDDDNNDDDNDDATDDDTNDDDDDDNNDDNNDDETDPCCVTGDPCALAGNGQCDCPDIPWDYPECLDDDTTPTSDDDSSDKEEEDNEFCCG